jgi:hypothetical protein
METLFIALAILLVVSQQELLLSVVMALIASVFITVEHVLITEA